MLRLLKEERKRVADNRIAAELLGSLLRPNPADREALDLLFAAVTEEPNERLVELAARYAPDWLMEHLPPPTANRSLSACIVYAPPERRAAMCAAIAASGSEHVRSLIGLLIDPDASPWVQRASEAVAQDPILGRALDEARSKAPARAPGRRPK
jgi:hypothetical protein